jgi:hypothetical protein
MYGSTAEPVKEMPLPCSNGASVPGAMQSTSLAICVDSPITTEVEHDAAT